MSLIASFYVLPASRTDDLIVAASPKRIATKKYVLGLIPITRSEEKDEFWDFLGSSAKESADFPYSGSVFCELDLFLSEEHTMLFDLAMKGLSERLSSVRATSMALFDYTSAQRASDMLSKVNCSADTVRHYCESAQSAWKPEELIGPLQTAVSRSKEWMRDIGPTDVGLLIVG